MKRRGRNKKTFQAGIPRFGNGNLMKLVAYQNQPLRKKGYAFRRPRQVSITDGITLDATKGYQRAYVGKRAAIAGHKAKGSPRAMRKLISVIESGKRSVKRFRQAIEDFMPF